MNILRYTLKFWIPLAAAITLVCGIIYITLQQSTRLEANELSASLAVDAANALEAGLPVAAVLPPGKIDLAQSLSAVVVVFDAQGLPLASNASLGGRLPTVPPGVFSYVDENGEDRITWQPAAGVRLAAVIRPVSGSSASYVLGAHSLREAENRIDLLLVQVGVGWAAALGITLALVLFFELIPFTRSG